MGLVVCNSAFQPEFLYKQLNPQNIAKYYCLQLQKKKIKKNAVHDPHRLLSESRSLRKINEEDNGCDMKKPYRLHNTENSYRQTQQVYHSTTIIRRFTGIATSTRSTDASATLFLH